MEESIQKALDAMEEMARKLQVHQGAGVVLVVDGNLSLNIKDLRPVFRVIHTFEREHDPDHQGEDVGGTNDLAVAWSKIAEMLRSWRPSGRDPKTPRGELQLRGGVLAYKDGVYTLAAFSGGNEYQDIVIALSALDGLGLTYFTLDY